MSEANKENPKEYLDFLIDKAHQSLFEAGKTVGHALFTYLLLVTLEALLVFGTSSDDKVKVPLLQVDLDKPYASAVILALSCISLYWFYSSKMTHLELAHNLKRLIQERYGLKAQGLRYIYYPSPSWVFSQMIDVDPKRVPSHHYMKALSSLFTNIFLIANCILPFLFAWRISITLEYTLYQKILVGLATLVLLSPSFIVTQIGIGAYGDALE